MNSLIRWLKKGFTCLGVCSSAIAGLNFIEEPVIAAADLAGHVILPAGCSNRATILILAANQETNWANAVSVAYPNLPRQVQTDGRGNFTVKLLDTHWRYSGFALAPGYKPEPFQEILPAAGPLNISLEPANPFGAAMDTVIRGRALDTEGNPISGALISVRGVTRNNSTTWPASDIDSFAVSDSSGNFIVYGRSAFTAAEGGVEAPGFLTSLFNDWNPGETVHEITLSKGASLKGRLLRNGSPVPGAEVRLDNFGSEAESDMWHYSVITDSRGVFFFQHLPPSRSCSFYATMQSLGGRGALSRQRVKVHQQNSTNDLGDINLQPAYDIRGQIRLSNAGSIPANSFMLLSRTDLVNIQDTLSTVPESNGDFAFIGVPSEPIQLRLRLPGYQLTPKDRFLIAGSSTNIMVLTNISNWVINMTPTSLTPAGF